ncbi:MAG: AAA family ATPase [Nannocystis sp.]|nr:AAA family ATPase [Nannocystis sp.]
MFAQLAEGVQALHHAHKLHRDIKPTNVMVTHQGRVVLMDFGFVGDESVGTLESTAGSMVVGTPAYMAPEQALGGPRTPPTDWYAFGATLYMALTGQVPFHGENIATLMERKQSDHPTPPRSLAAGIPEDLEQLCMQLLQPLPEHRPTGADLLERLHQGSEVSHTRGFAYLSPAATHVGARRFIGRGPEALRLRGAYASVCTDGRPAVVLLCSRAGLGKSALIRHVTDELRRSTVVLRARCYERDGVPFKALDSLVDALARHLRQQPRPELAPAVAALAPLFPVLQTAAAGAEPPSRPADHLLGPDAFAALRHLLARLTAPRPLTLWIDDLQWGDEGSVRALQALLAPPDPPPVLLIASYRSEDRDTSPALRVLQDMSLAPGLSVQAIELGPLDPEETLALASAVLGADTAPARLAKLAAEAQGSPQFVHDLARFVAHGRGAAPEVTLDELLEIRIARLSEPQRRLLDLIAVAGGPVHAATALRAAEVAKDARVVVHELLGLGLLRSLSAADGERLDAYHERTREVVLAHLDGTALRALHATLAAALAAALAAQPDDHADHELLSRLYRGAGDVPRARHHAGLAARAAATARDFDRAAAILLRTSEWSPAEAPALHIQRAEALARAGRSRAAADAYLAARTGVDRETQIECSAHAALHLLSAGHLEDGRKALADGFTTAGLALPAASVRGRLAALWRRGRMAVRGLQWSERPASEVPRAALARVDLLRAATVGALVVDPGSAADIQAQHLLLSLETGEPSHIGRAIALEATLAAQLGPAGRPRCLAMLAEARALAQRLNDRETTYLVEMVLLLDAAQTGDFAAVLARAEALTANADLALPHARNLVDGHGLLALLQLGRLPLLAERLPPRLHAAAEHDDRCAQVTLHGLDLWLRLARDDLPAAHAALAAAERAWPHPPALGYHNQHLQLTHARVVLHLYTGHPARAVAVLQDDAPALARAGVAQTHAASVLMAELGARVHVAAWRQQPADTTLRRAAARAVDDLHAHGAHASAALLRASLHPESAASLLRAAADEFAASGRAIHHATALLRLHDPAGAAALGALGVVDPDRLAGVLAP